MLTNCLLDIISREIWQCTKGLAIREGCNDEDWFQEIPNTVTGDPSPILQYTRILAHYELHRSRRSGPYKGTLLHERRPAALLAAHTLALKLPCI